MSHLPRVFALLVFLSGIAAAETAKESLRWFPGEKGGAFPGAKVEKIGDPKPEKDPKLGAVLVFNGKSDALLVDKNPIQGDKAFTIEVLFQPAADGPREQRFFHIQDATERRLLFETRLDAETRWCLDSHAFETKAVYTTLIDFQKVFPSGAWYWVATVFDGLKISNYVNGVQQNAGEIAFGPLGEGCFTLGVRQNRVHWFKGKVRELRFHHRALAPAELQVVQP